jgi:hypothetical protein
MSIGDVVYSSLLRDIVKPSIHPLKVLVEQEQIAADQWRTKLHVLSLRFVSTIQHSRHGLLLGERNKMAAHGFESSVWPGRNHPHSLSLLSHIRTLIHYPLLKRTQNLDCTAFNRTP